MTGRMLVLALLAPGLACSPSEEQTSSATASSVNTVPLATNSKYEVCVANIDNNPHLQGAPSSTRELMIQGSCAGFLENR